MVTAQLHCTLSAAFDENFPLTAVSLAIDRAFLLIILLICVRFQQRYFFSTPVFFYVSEINKVHKYWHVMNSILNRAFNLFLSQFFFKDVTSPT